MRLTRITQSTRRVGTRCSYCPLAIGLVLAVLSGCQGGLNVRSTFPDGSSSERRMLENFERSDVDYANLSSNRADVQTMTAGHGYGTLESENGPLTEYLNHILRKLISASPVPEMSARVVVVDTVDSPLAVAFPDGSIYVPLRLLEDMNNAPNSASEDALAFLLGHELAHIMDYHYSSDAVGTLFSTGVVGFELAMQIANLLGEIKGEQVVSEEKSQKLYTRFLAAKAVEEKIISPSWTRSQENKADLLGFDLMMKAGYNPNAAYDFLDFLYGYESEAQRIAKEREASAVAEQKDLGGLLGLFVTQVVESVSRDHPTVAWRRESVIEYHERWQDDILDAEDVEIRALAWHEDAPGNVVEEADASRIRSLFSNYREAVLGRQALLDSDYAKAQEHLAQSLSSPTEYNAYPRMVAAWYATETGDDDAAVQHLRSALENGPGASFLIYEQLLFRLARRGDHAGAVEVLDRAQSRFGHYMEVFRWRATILDMQDRNEEATEVRETCLGEYRLQLKQRQRCHERVEMI